ncbi:MAG: UbiA family prenyltransferase [Nitrospirae bacterium]|nr:UbiA family prenyltransferase [Nitrospirota bacterium]
MFSAIKAYLELCRVSNLPTVWTNVLAAIVLTGAGFSLSDLIIIALSMSLFYSGGMCFNDIADAETDRTGKPFRPIPSGRIVIGNAYIFTIALFAVAICILLLVPFITSIYPALLLLSLIIIYDKFHKAHPLSVILMAACRLMIFVIAAIAVTGTVGKLVLIGGLIQFVYVLAISLTARYENNRTTVKDFSVIPVMIACISLIDGVVMALFVSPVWLTAGIAGAILTHFSQRYVRGD